jgi:hypothetical protein
MPLSARRESHPGNHKRDHSQTLHANILRLFSSGRLKGNRRLSRKSISAKPE